MKPESPNELFYGAKLNSIETLLASRGLQVQDEVSHHAAWTLTGKSDRAKLPDLLGGLLEAKYYPQKTDDILEVV